MLKRHEGLSLKPYKCPAGKKTIGVGWNFDANPLPKDIAAYLKANGEISPDMVERLLDISIETAKSQCLILFSGFDSFSRNRKDALIDFVFNVGAGTASTFKGLRAAAIERDWPLAASHLQHSKWYGQVGRRAPEIVNMILEG